MQTRLATGAIPAPCTAGPTAPLGTSVPAVVDLLPAMAPYALDWPRHPPVPASARNVFADLSDGGTIPAVHTNGHRIQYQRGWYSPQLGFFPDGDPQMWVHDREVWVLYDMWARAKGIATGVISASSFG